jgi:hypothetical protein
VLKRRRVHTLVVDEQTSVESEKSLNALLEAAETVLRRCCVDGSGPGRRGGFWVIRSSSELSSPPAGYRFPRQVIAVAVRWYLRYGLSYRDVEELLAERGIQVDHVTVYRWVQTFTPEFIDAARPARHSAGVLRLT